MSLLHQTQDNQRQRPVRRADLRRLTRRVQEAKQVSGLGLTTLYAMLGDGRLRSTKVGRKRLIIADSLEEALTSTAA